MIRSEGSNELFRAVALPAAIALLVLAAIVGTVLQVSTTQSDDLALNRQNQRMTVAIEQSEKGLAVDQEASTYWDDAVTRTRERPLDLEWIDNNLGVWFHTFYQFDEVYLLDQRNAPIYAMQDGRRTAPASFGRVAAPALELAVQLRKKLSVSRLATDGTQAKTVGASEIAAIAGRPALVSVKPIVSETGNIAQAPGSEYLHVAVRYLDASFLDGLSKVYVIDGPRFSATNPGPAAVALNASNRRTLGYITWEPFEPGKQVEEKMLPVLIMVFFAIGALLTLLLLRIRRGRVELEASRAHAQHLAFHDSLTGLPNRALFEDRLEIALVRREANVAVLLLDLDRFKMVNDTLGHPAGDSLIREFGERLTSLTRECDTIARLGGDEFAILIEDASPADVRRLATRIVRDIRRPFQILGTQVHVGVSIGIANVTDAAADPLELVRRADIALYEAKDGGRDAYRLFRPEMDEKLRLRRTIEEELRFASAA